MSGTPFVEVVLDEQQWRETQVRNAVASLQGTPRTLDPVWFYDKRGSDLFDEITRLPEYYLTRAERSLLQAHASEIAELGVATLVELGSGTSDKTRVLLDAMTGSGSLQLYVPVDVSEQTLREAAHALAFEYPQVQIRGIVADFHSCFDRLPRADRRLVAFLGSTIGNLDPAQRDRFFFDLDCALERDDLFLLGIDLVKEADRLLAAYDDGAGVTAAFNRNALMVLNEGIGSDFDPENFEHVAVWDGDSNRIEMRLRARLDHDVSIPGADSMLHFRTGEFIRTEISSKFTIEGMTAELSKRNLIVEKVWISEGDEFALLIARPYC